MASVVKKETKTDHGNSQQQEASNAAAGVVEVQQQQQQPSKHYRRSSFSKGFDHREKDSFLVHFPPTDNNNKNHNDVPAAAAANDPSIELQFLPPDQRRGDLLLAAFVEPEIEEDTEAAEALRANAQVKVGKVSKAARGINAQTVRKLVKRASLRGHGIKRGKPPRVPPGLASFQQHQPQDLLVRDGEEIYALQEGDDESECDHDDHYDEHEHNDHEHDDGYDSEAQYSETSPRNQEPTEKSTSNESHTKQQQQSHPVRDGDEKSHPQRSEIASCEESNDAKQYHAITPHHHLHHDDDERDIPKEVVAETMDVGRKLMGALDPHNMLQVQRWRRKKNSKKKKRKSYVKGKVIDGKHELYTLSIAVMLGVRTSIARTNTIISSSDGAKSKILSPQDFMAEEKYEFAPKGSPTTPPHKLSHTFKFKDYAPVAFAYLRRMFGVNEFDFLLSVCGNANFIEFISNAKSGQFFFYSSDGKYMIKTMTNSESKFLRRILPHYFRHCTENPNTLLAKFFGMYRVKLYHLRRNVKFIIMNSVYYTDKSIQTFFDLKGSEIGRSAKPGQDVLKDNDLRKNLGEDAFSFEPKQRKRFRAQIESDCNFLRKMQIMDYSMLIGIHHIPPKTVNRSSNIADTGFKIQEHRAHRKSNSRGQNDFEQLALDATNRSTRSVGSDAANSVVNESSSSPGTTTTTPASAAASGANDASTKHLIKDIRENAYSNANFEFAGLLEDEDDCSYLEGSNNYNKQFARKLKAYQQHPKFMDIEKKKEQTIEQIYWPFHRFYDINGHRRMKPKTCFSCQKFPCVCEGVSDLIKAWKIPEFVPPLSDRKDGGVVMDTSHLKMPMVFDGKQGKMAYEGKIYYMGIIDILQQYNARKRAETRYRKMEVRGKAEPSCVSPDDYAERFVSFFDEYSQKAQPNTYGEEESTEIEVVTNEFKLVRVTSNNKLVPPIKDGHVGGSAKVTPGDSKGGPLEEKTQQRKYEYVAT